MLKYKFLEYIELVFCFITVLFIPFSNTGVRYSIGFWLLFALVNYIINKKEKLKLDSKLLSILLLPLLYIFNIIWLLNTNNIEEGIFNLEIKMSLFFIPILVYLRKSFYISNKLNLIRVFITGCLVALFVSYINSYIIYQTITYPVVFYYAYLAWFSHPTYISIFVVSSLIFLFEYHPKELFFNKNYAKYVSLFLVIIFLVYLIMLASKAAILSFCLISVFYYRKVFSDYISNKIIVYAISLFLATTQFLVIQSIPILNGRFSNITSDIRHEIDTYKEEKVKETSPKKVSKEKPYTSGSTATRIYIWRSALDVAKNNFIFGTGTGDVVDEITKVHKSLKPGVEEIKEYNAHNQYFESLIRFGFLGFVVIALIVLSAIYHSFKTNDLLFFYFSLIIAFNLLFESILQRQYGIVYFALFYTLFFIWNTDKSKDINSSKIF